MLAVESRVRGAGSHSPAEAMEEDSPACSPVCSPAEESPPRGNLRSSRLPSPESTSTRSNEFRRSPSPATGRSHINVGNSNITSTTGTGASNNNNNNIAAGMYSIVVAVRKRPKIVGREDNENDIVRCETKTTLAVYEPGTKLDLTPIVEPSVFSFDTVYDENCSNAQIYHDCCQPLLQNVRDGGGAVVFAFGQTGSGKTYTMLGQNDAPGLYGLAVKALLDMTTRETLTASFFEVYGAKLYDLLNDRAPVKMLQDEYKNIHIVGLTERTVRSISDVDALMTSGQLLRATGTTHANDRSSRSHAVLEIKVKLSESPSDISASMEPNTSNSNNSSSEGRITFVDLAGSERASDTAEATSQTRREGAEINKSLLALKECIRAMSMRKKHIPFRGSKLTQILRESFMGNCKTCVIATISPCQSHCEDTINTLRYAYRIKELKGKANGLQLEAPIPCQNCGLPIFMGDRHVCRRFVVQCPHCRVEMDKGEIEAHLIECKEFPLRCPHCNERMLRGELDRHNRRCTRLPIKCNTCGQFIARNAMERHVEVECTGVKRKCRFCYQLITRGQMTAHEAQCEMRKVACPFCLQFVRSHKLEAHQSTCVRNPNVHRSTSTTNTTNNPITGNNNEVSGNTHNTSLATTPTGHSLSVSRSASRNARADWVNNNAAAVNVHNPLDIPNSTRRLSSLSNPEAGIEAVHHNAALPHMINLAERPLELAPDKRSGGVASKSATPEQTETEVYHKNSTSNNNTTNRKNKSMPNEGKDAVVSSASLILLPTHLSHTALSNLSNSHESGSTSPIEAKATLKYNAAESTSRTNRLREARLEVTANEQANKSNNGNVRASSQQKYKYNASRQFTNRLAKNDARNANNIVTTNNTPGSGASNLESGHEGAGKGNNALQNRIGFMNAKNYPEQLINSNRSPALTSNIMNGFHLDNIDQKNNNNNTNNKNNANIKDKKQNNNNYNTNNNNSNSSGNTNNGVVMTCPYSRYGCVVKVTPLNLQSHLQQALQEHLELVTLYADRLDAQNVELRRAIVLREPGDSAATTPAKEEQQQQRQLAQRSNDAQKVSAITSQEAHRWRR